jgi:predicted O-methyltransferase YrrM
MKKLIKKIIGKKNTDRIAKVIVSKSINKIYKSFERNEIKDTAEELTNLVFSKKGQYIRPWQHPEEFLALAQAAEGKRPKIVLEIGTAMGGSLLMLTRLAADDALIVSIDLPGGIAMENGEVGGGYPEWKIPLYKSFAKNNQRIELIRDDSHSERVLNQLEKILDGRKIDFAFIDGDHSYEGVKKDFNLYKKLYDSGALIAFHDIVSDKRDESERDNLVSVFWDEIKNEYTFTEHKKDENQSQMGIGILKIK